MTINDAHIDVGLTQSWRPGEFEVAAFAGRWPNHYGYRAFARWEWLARFRAWFGVWRHLHGWPEPKRTGLVHRVLAGKRLK